MTRRDDIAPYLFCLPSALVALAALLILLAR